MASPPAPKRRKLESGQAELVYEPSALGASIVVDSLCFEQGDGGVYWVDQTRWTYEGSPLNALSFRTPGQNNGLYVPATANIFTVDGGPSSVCVIPLAPGRVQLTREMSGASPLVGDDGQVIPRASSRKVCAFEVPPVRIERQAVMHLTNAGVFKKGGSFWLGYKKLGFTFDVYLKECPRGGKYRLLQTCQAAFTAWDWFGKKTEIGTGGQCWLDAKEGEMFYPAVVTRIPRDDQVRIWAEDGPSLALDQKWQKVMLDGRFSMYIVYVPPGGDNFCPIARADWVTRAEAGREDIGHPWVGKDNTPSQQLGFVMSSERPQVSGHTASMVAQWEREFERGEAPGPRPEHKAEGKRDNNGS